MKTLRPHQAWYATSARWLVLSAGLWVLSGCASPPPKMGDSGGVDTVQTQPDQARAGSRNTDVVDPATRIDGSVQDPIGELSRRLENPPTDEPPLSSTEVMEEGMASFYGRKFHGRRTASGERFDMHDLTAAHPSLPFGSRVRVRNVRNGEEVVVRINDRGPFKKGRVIDVSRAAAEALGMVGRGLARVQLLRE
ncbi:septal ring lytic transglycosylase RlpA family protein [Hydrogenophaga sp. 5NK40-0174]|uniref:septal ring lytic transglycosylase RlpA family protein n=1 Tax=Hydrogenophaga sp. 5NK40-0174 TaxID=3127649 RepID=UPI003101E792